MARWRNEFASGTLLVVAIFVIGVIFLFGLFLAPHHSAPEAPAVAPASQGV